MRKRIIAMALAGTMMAGLLAGCGSTGDVPTDDAAQAMDGGAVLDTGGGEGRIGGSEETNADLAGLVDLQEDEMEEAGNTGDGGAAPADVDIDADAGAMIGASATAVMPPMPEEIENTGLSAVAASDIVNAVGASAIPAPVAVQEDSLEDIQDEMVAMAASTFQTYLPTASTTNVRNTNNYGYVDYGNAADGYVVVCYTANTPARIKCVVKGPSGVQYTYNLAVGAVTTLPLSDGSGTYSIGLYENVTGSKYAKNLSQDVNVQLNNEFGPFLYSNQYVDYMAAANTRATGADLCGRAPDLLGKVDQVYTWVVNNLTYDYNKAKTVQSGYVPVLDDVLAKRTGICFDYAALMAGMLRSQGIPCKLVVGYAGTAYHAWISVWSAETGWIEGVVYFDGKTWQRMDPTFASSGGQSASIMQYIGDGANYQEKYLY